MYFALKYIILFKASELILNPDGSIYHLHLKPADIADTIITVGDPDRVPAVSRHFDSIVVKKNKREFITHTGFVGKKLVTVISTGIGTDNIDIVFNELDALSNINLDSRTTRKVKKSLTFIRIGTSGSIREEMPLDSFLFSSGAIGLDGLMHFYESNYTKREEALKIAFQQFIDSKEINLTGFYPATASEELHNHFVADHFSGITLTCSGFYGPQGRSLRLNSMMRKFLKDTADFTFEYEYLTNLEMETAGIYALASALGHRAISCNVLLADRMAGTFSVKPKKSIDKLIEYCLEKIEGL